MNKILATVLLLAPSVADAHEGPPHVHGDDPHLLAAAGVFVAVGLVVAVLRRVASRKAVRS